MANSLVFTTTELKNNNETVATPSTSEKIIPIVFLHGWGVNSGVWQPLIEQLCTSLKGSTDVTFKLITIDLPGFGLNVNKQVSPYSLECICENIAKVIDEPAVYIGWSLGGLVATKMALNFPQQVMGLVTVASTPCFLSSEGDDVSDNWPGIKSSVLQVFYKQLQGDIEKTIKGFLKIQAMGSPSIRQDIKHISKLVMDYDMPSKSTLEQSLDLLKTSDLRTQLGTIKIPFLQLYGEADSLVPKQAIPLIKAQNSNTEQHIFSKASHAPFISHLDDFTKVLTHWLVGNFK